MQKHIDQNNDGTIDKDFMKMLDARAQQGKHDSNDQFDLKNQKYNT